MSKCKRVLYNELCAMKCILIMKGDYYVTIIFIVDNKMSTHDVLYSSVCCFISMHISTQNPLGSCHSHVQCQRDTTPVRSVERKGRRFNVTAKSPSRPKLPYKY